MTVEIDTRRPRLIDAMVLVVRERGYAGASVTSVCARAKLSRRTFCEQFDGVEDCFLAVLDEGARHASTLMTQAFEREESWVAGVRGALAALLSFFDSEPALAHVLLVEASSAGPWARERREQHIASLTELIEERWGAPEDGHAHPLVNPGVMASLLGVLHTHLVEGRPEPLITLLGPLMGLVSAPYLGRRRVTREIERADTIARELLARRAGPQEGQRAARRAEPPALLQNPRAHRARAVLLYLAAHPQASNRQIADGIGVIRHEQISRLLARLAGLGLLAKHPGAAGHPNAWSLTEYGVRVLGVVRHWHASHRAAPVENLAIPATAVSQTRHPDECTSDTSTFQGDG